jgi:hypothetical protein
MKQGLVVVVGVLALMQLAGRAAAESPTEKRIRLLEEQLRRTQDEIRELKSQIQQQQAIGQATQRQTEQAEEQAKAATTAQKGVEVPEWLKRTTIFGDVRARHEGFYHQPHAKETVVTARNRERIRARLGVKVTLSDEVSATIRGASGDPGNPISTNDNLTGNFNRKHFNLDWAYLTFSPGSSFGMRPGTASLSFGKFPNPLFLASEMVFDDDLSPEGAVETFQLLGQPLGSIDQVKVHALQWTFNEVANKEDGWMFGGQVNPTLHFGPVQLDVGVGQYWWLNPDQIAQALSRNTTDFTTAGAPVANQNFNSALTNSNLLVTKTIQPPTPPGGKKPAAFTAITGYQSGFNQTDADLLVTFPNVIAAQPLRVFSEFVYNWDAINHDAYGYLGGLRLGQTKVRNDWAVYAFYERLEQEAAISAFTYSDYGPGGISLHAGETPLGTTNLEGPVVGVEYQLLNPLTLSARGHFTNFINRPAGVTNPTLTRLLLDAVVKF